MNDIIKINKPLEESGLLIKEISKTIKNEAKEQKQRFPSMLFDALGASVLINLVVRKDIKRAAEGTIRSGECTVRAGKDFLSCLIF